MFRKQNRRFDEGQFTKVGCNTRVLKQRIIIGDLGRIPLDDDRSGGWMEWSGAVKGRAGIGVGDGEGKGEGRGARGMGRGVTTVPFYIAAR